MRDNREQVLEVDIWQLVKALWQHAWIIVLSTIVGGVLAFGYARYFVTPNYSADVMLYFNSGSFTVGSTSINISGSSNSGAMESYLVILKTRTTLERVIEEASLPYTYEELKGMITAGQVGGTPILKLTVTTANPKEAATIANAIAEVLQYNISRMVSGCNVQLVDSASVPMSRTSPSYTRYIEIGLLAGFLISCAVIVMTNLMDDTIHGEEYLLQTFDVPVLAMIPTLQDDQQSYGYYSTSAYDKGRTREV